MKVKRGIFIVFLIFVFIICFFKMNEHYDELARYPYELNDEQRDLVLTYFDAEEINYLVTQKIKPEEFLPYIDVEGFTLTNTLWYDRAYKTRKDNKEYIVSFINKYRSQLKYDTLDDILKHYSYNILKRFFDEGDSFDEEAVLVTNPSDMYTILNEHETLYIYEPNKLVSINDLPHNAIGRKNDVVIREEVVKPLKELGKAMREINKKDFAGLEISAGYVSYESQHELYYAAKEKYGDKVSRYFDSPGRNEYQLGYTIQLRQPHSKDDEDDKELKKEVQEKAIWLKDNAYKYGFVVRYPKSKENVTLKKYQPFGLRYVGKDVAKYMQENKLVLEELNLNDVK